jgi:hypothetical protein
VIEDATTYRSKEQVLCDLAKALQFSPESLEANRAGRLSKEQTKQISKRCLKPAIVTLLFALGPLLFWTHSEASSQDISFGAGFLALIHEIMHLNDLFEAHGKLGGGILLGSILISLGIAALLASRVPFALYFDLLDQKVIMSEGRVVAREETIHRPNGRDPIEKYFFSLRYLNMPVNLKAYRALEAGSIYLVYLLPRSEELVSIEPKVEGEPDMSGDRTTAEPISAQGSAIRIS